jgi:methanogenic corrinoid protein MtbC1
MCLIKSELKSALLDFDTDKVKALFSRQVVRKEISIPMLIEEVLSEIGKEWESGELALSQVYMSGKICEEVIEEILGSNPNIEVANSKIAIVTFNDFHSLGKKITLSVLRSVGYVIIDWGQGISLQTLVEKIEKEKIDILLISVLMLPSALKIKDLREELDKKKCKLKILVGGAPFNFDKKLWTRVGADAMGSSPTDAIDILNEWLNDVR